MAFRLTYADPSVMASGNSNRINPSRLLIALIRVGLMIFLLDFFLMYWSFFKA